MTQFVDTRASGHLLSAAQGLGHFVEAAKAAAAEVMILDPLYSAHDQDENDARANLALSLAAGVDRIGFSIPAPRRVLSLDEVEKFLVSAGG